MIPAKQAQARANQIISRGEIETLTDELVRRWAPLFEPKSWPERLQLLGDLHEQLQDDIGDFDVYATVSRVFIKKLIACFNDGEPVSSSSQAYVYANSDDEKHRHAAAQWLSRQVGADI